MVTDAPATTRRGSPLIAWAAGGAASLALLVASFRDVNLDRVVSLLGGLGFWTPLLVLPSFAALVLESHAWQAGLGLAGHRPRLVPLLGVRVASESIGGVLPLGAVWADALKPSLLSTRCGLPMPAGVAAIAIRKYLLVLSQAGYLALAFILGHEALRRGFSHATGMPALSLVAPIAACALAGVATTMAALLGRGGAFRGLVDRLAASRLRFVADRATRLRLGALGTDDVASAFFRTPWHERARPVFVCLAAWLCEATETWLVLRALGAGLEWGDAVGVEALVVLSRHLLPFLPGGLGVQELGYTALLAGVGCDVERAASLVVLKRLREATWIAVGALVLTGAGSRWARERMPVTA
ncbi:MAG TPA: lysylphosphatidylglycerol synthase domain-containing protein [Polyangiaceae bacterium]|jgi:uncharacterized membrane protein YbhN (UPF0104 family)|nr:lysylphosphatidylglycerol synthase domain-containing protein [Polyangiaceae bacterium]